MGGLFRKYIRGEKLAIFKSARKHDMNEKVLCEQYQLYWMFEKYKKSLFLTAVFFVRNLGCVYFVRQNEP